MLCAVASHREGTILHFVRSADDIRIAYEVGGRGTPMLVFVHGWSCDRGTWRGTVATFAREATVVALDLAGHGSSGVGRSAWTIEAFSEDVAAVVRALGLARVVLVGHSMGGDVAVEAARRLPGLVSGLVWVDTYRQLRSPRTDAEVEALLAPLRADFVAGTRAFVRGMFPPDADPALVERVAGDMAAAPPAVALDAFGHAMRYGRRVVRALRETRLPVIALLPDHAPSDVASLTRCGIEVVPLAGVGHFPMLEAPARFDAALRGALERLARSA